MLSGGGWLFQGPRQVFYREFLLGDIAYVAGQIGVDPAVIRTDDYSKETFSRHQHLILDYFGFVAFDETTKAFAVREIATLVRVQFRPKLILLEIILAIARRKIALPSYNTLANLIVAALNHHQQTLAGIVGTCLTEEQCHKLDELLTKEPVGANADEGLRYRLTLLKKPYHSTRPTKIRANLADLQTLQERYLDLKSVMARLDLSYECIRYYAYSVIKAQIPQVSRRADEDRYLHLIAFVAYQTFKLNDTLIDTLLSAVQSAVNAAQKEHKESYFQEREQRNQSLAALVDRLDKGIRATLTEIKRIIADPQLSSREKVALIDDALVEQASNPSTVEQQIDQFKLNLTVLNQGRDYYAMLEERSLKLQHRAADIVRQMQFSPNCSKPSLWKALQHTSVRTAPSTKARRTHFSPANNARP